jgi:hypothetical protein
MKIKSSSQTRGLSMLVAMIYVLYGLFRITLPILLLSVALGLIVHGFVNSLEISVAIIIVSGIVLSYMAKRSGYEGFESKNEDDKNKDDKKKDDEEEKPPAAAPGNSGSADDTKKEKSGFSDMNPAPLNGAFKEGQVPKDDKGGFFIDQGTTLLNALNGLKPEQISAMTNDTKQLLDTQKSLMGMLNTLAPMMKEGSNLLGMFNGMFGGGGATPK